MIDFKAIENDLERAKAVLNEVVVPSLLQFKEEGFPGNPSDPVMLTNMLAISGQESDWIYRDQQEIINGRLSDGRLGPALGLWQFEKGNRMSRGGVTGVMLHPASAPWFKIICANLGIPFESDTVWRKCKTDDFFAAKVARLLIWTDPFKIPSTEQAAWVMYAQRLWRPGKPFPAKWPKYWTLATAAVRSL